MQNENIKSVIKDSKAQLQAFRDMKEERHMIRSRTNWMRSENRMNQFIYSYVKDQPLRGLITK